MTVKLYDNDSFLTEFSATVLSCEKSGDGYKILLDQTAFFPEEGGQCSDRGFLGGIEISYAQLCGDEIYHYSKAPLEAGKTVKGEIDFNLRFRNMQNHSGEHILCGIAHRLFGYENVGFHLGEDCVTMDLNGPLSQEDADKIEFLANQAIYRNMPISAYYPEKEELEKLNYRAKGEILNNVRVVTIGDVDSCACCAPHVKFTGEIGIIKILDVMKYKGGVRLSILCGLDALNDYKNKHVQNIKISNLLSAKQDETFKAVEKLSDSISHLNEKLSLQAKKIAEYMVKSIDYTEKNICLFADDCDMNMLRLIANDLKDKTSSYGIILSGDNEEGYKYVIISKEKDVADFTKELNSALSGKGGGRGSMSSGTFKATRAEIEKKIKEN